MLISFPPPLTLSRQSKWRNSALLCLLFISISTLSGCATLNKGDCLKGDWAAIGYNDIESLQSDISSKRSDQSQLRTWHAVWAR